MTQDQLDLARRLVAHPRWKWVDGMAIAPYAPPFGRVVVDDDAPPAMVTDMGFYPLKPEELPDLSDYATAAILLRMAMEAGRMPAPLSRALGEHGEVYMTFDGTVAAQALLAAWGEEGAGRRDT